MPRVPFFASRIALVSVLTGMSSLLGCGDSGPSTTGTATTSAGGSSSSSAASSSGSGGGASSSSVSSGSGGSTSASSSSGAGGSGGASASSSSSGASGSSSSSTGGGAGGLGDPCTTSADCVMPPPGSAFFCDRPGCGAGPGTCALQPKSQIGLSQAEAAVCGCDHVTYWNADYAAFRGVSIGAQGVCAAGGGVACSPTTPCPGTMKCNRPVADQPQCSASATGTCWSMPASCPPGGAAAKACSNGSCQSLCDLIQSQNPWWSDATCP